MSALSKEITVSGYKVTKGITKGIGMYLYVVLAAAVAVAFSIQTATPADGTAADIQWSIPLLVSLIPAALRVGLNFLKVVNPSIVPQMLRELVMKLSCILLMLCLVGCARSNANFDANITTAYDTDGNITTVIDRTRFKQQNVVTVGSKLQEGAGEMIYDWSEAGGQMAVGNAAKGLEAGQMDEIVLGLFNLLLQGYGMKMNTPPDQPDWWENSLEHAVNAAIDRILVGLPPGTSTGTPSPQGAPDYLESLAE